MTRGDIIGDNCSIGSGLYRKHREEEWKKRLWEKKEIERWVRTSKILAMKTSGIVDKTEDQLTLNSNVQVQDLPEVSSQFEKIFVSRFTPLDVKIEIK